jgi:DNA topoisomerase-1
MAKNLVIVESPAKAKTIGKYLGRDYQVKASVGHIMDLPKSKLGVDVENDFAAEYHVIPGKSRIVEELRKAAKDKEHIYLASDPDREGEAIAWHIAEKIDKKGKKVHRLLLNEITKKAVQEAIKKPVSLSRERYDAQIARRVLDRLVGYQISPLLWKKVRRGLSAGRVQSVAVRILTEREREIQAFVAEEYWSIIATLHGKIPPQFEARLAKVGDKRLDNKTFRINNEAEAKDILAHLDGATWTVAKVEKRDRRRNPAPPFITSRLQQEASRKLGYSPARTMGIAQRLYMGVELGDEGAVGLITYMRTDSPRISPDMMNAARDYIKDSYGEPYVPEKPNLYRSSKSAQEAHEAIRPTSLEYSPERVAPYLSREELNLYTLIWNRFMASQMAPALFEQTSVDITAHQCTFRATGQVLRFDGFLRVYMEGRDDKTNDDDDDDEKQLPPLNEGDVLQLLQITPNQHFTQPPPRFTQATLIKELEEKGIGRPSTYASIMDTILSKEYVQEDEQRRLRPTQLGMLITDLLVESFPDILNTEFTAGMEGVLDQIEDGQEDWQKAIARFYKPFSADLERAEKEMRDVKGSGEPTGLACDVCNDGEMMIKWGRNGEFLACSKYPECRSTRNFVRNDQGKIIALEKEPVLTDETCEQCSKPMQVRFGRYGKFLGCSGYPECTNVRKMGKPVTSLGVTCPDCNEGDIQQKWSRRGKVFYSCSRYPKCTFALWDRPIPESCPRCQAPFVVEKITKRAGTTRRCIREECDYQEAVDTAEAEAEIVPVAKAG